MSIDPRLMCELLVGLDDVNIESVERLSGGQLRVGVSSRSLPPTCERCAHPRRLKDRKVVDLVDLPAFGQHTRVSVAQTPLEAVLWQRVRGRPNDRIASPGLKLTARASRWGTRQVG